MLAGLWRWIADGRLRVEFKLRDQPDVVMSEPAYARYMGTVMPGDLVWLTDDAIPRRCYDSGSGIRRSRKVVAAAPEAVGQRLANY